MSQGSSTFGTKTATSSPAVVLAEGDMGLILRREHTDHRRYLGVSAVDPKDGSHSSGPWRYDGTRMDDGVRVLIHNHLTKHVHDSSVRRPGQRREPFKQPNPASKSAFAQLINYVRCCEHGGCSGLVVPTPVNASNMVFKVPGLGIARGVERHREGGFEEQVERTTRTLHGFSHERVDEYAEMYLPSSPSEKHGRLLRGCGYDGMSIQPTEPTGEQDLPSL